MTKAIKLTKTVIDGATNTAVEVELTSEEIAEVELRELQAMAAQEAAEAELAAKASAKASAMQKLSALGLSDEEVAALLG
jgi:hypothetical protein